MKKKPQYLLDECVQIKNKKLCRQLGYINSKDIAKEGITDDKLLEKALKKNLIIITKDVRFALQCVLQEVTVVFQDSHGIRTLIPKTKTSVIESNCFSRKYNDELTYHLITFDKIILP